MANVRIPANDAVRAARRGTAILAALPSLLILPLLATLLLLGPTQTQARIKTIKQAWEDGGGTVAAKTLSECMRQAGYASEPNLMRAYLMSQTVEKCEGTALKMANLREELGRDAYVAGAPTPDQIQGAIDERKEYATGILSFEGR